MNDHWIANWNRTLNHEGVIRGAQALLALSCVLAFGWRAEWQDALMPVLLGVLAGAFTETDDNWSGRLKAQLLALGAFALVVAAVWLAIPSSLTLAAVLALCAFVLTMLGALGERYRAIAFGALVLFIYTALSAQNNRDHALEVAPYLLGGAAWYGLVSLCWDAAWPRPTVRHRLSHLYAMLGEYLRLKSQLLEPVSDVDLASRRLELALHNGRVVFTSQPHYAATLSRAVQRAIGTVFGLAIGWALIRMFPGALLQAACVVVSGALFIGKRQTDLRTAAAAITTLVLLSFHQMGMSQGVIPARLLDAALGSAISALAAWLVLPNWQARQLPHLAAQALHAQAGYLHAILLQYQDGKQDHLAYRLARRNAHNADAALANAYGAMRQEPASTRLNEAACGQFVVLSHMLLNFLSALGAHRGEFEAGAMDGSALQVADQLQKGLKSLSQLLDLSSGRLPLVHRSASSASPVEAGGSQKIQRLLLAQLHLANRLLPELGKQALLFRAPR